MEALKHLRQEAELFLPPVLEDPCVVHLVSEKSRLTVQSDIQRLFPHLANLPLLRGKVGERRASKPLRIGVVFSGGQAAGGHNVILGIHDCLQKLHTGSNIVGFLDGPGGIVSGKYKELTSAELHAYRNLGGFDMIGSGRTKIETPEQLSSALKVVQQLSLDGLVIIGGDDSNTNAALLAEYFLANSCSTRVIGVPKTIDGDLQNAYVDISFGFDTACRTYCESIGNIGRDALSAKKYYHFIKLMGRSASHIALECALATQPNLTFVGEEIAAQKRTLQSIVTEIVDLVMKRAELGKNYGIILIPEGLIEFIPEMLALIQELNQLLVTHSDLTPSQAMAHLSSETQTTFSSLPEGIQNQLLLNRDSHGNVQVSLIETERLLSELVESRLKATKVKFAAVNHFLGYEGRAAYPTPFDSNYCYALGFVAALLMNAEATGYMAYVSNLAKPMSQWGIGGVPLTPLMHLEMRKGKEKPVIAKTLVNLQRKPFLELAEKREEWKIQDHYLYPGPIQFFGPSCLQGVPPLLLTD